MVKVGVQLHPQHASVATIRAAAREVDDAGFDSLWLWDHFYPLYGSPDGEHFEGWTLLAALAADTSQVPLGMLVTGGGYRNPDLLADMARTVDHVAGGRCILGIGGGWFERDYDEYGFEFGTATSRLHLLEDNLKRVRARTARLNPPPIGRLPIMIGGAGEKITLRLVAEYGDMWNTFGPPDSWGRKNEILDEWCSRVGRDPAEIERTVLLNAKEHDQIEAFVALGADHVILQLAQPFELLEAHHIRERHA